MLKRTTLGVTGVAPLVVVRALLGALVKHARYIERVRPILREIALLTLGVAGRTVHLRFGIVHAPTLIDALEETTQMEIVVAAVIVLLQTTVVETSRTTLTGGSTLICIIVGGNFIGKPKVVGRKIFVRVAPVDIATFSRIAPAHRHALKIRFHATDGRVGPAIIMLDFATLLGAGHLALVPRGLALLGARFAETRHVERVSPSVPVAVPY
jgi:hypothetical protein